MIQLICTIVFIVFYVSVFYFCIYISIVFKEGEGIQLKGIIGLISSLIYIIAFGFIFYSLSVLLLEAENKKRKREDIFNYFFLFLFLPVGIWILFPKIRLLSQRQKP